MAFSKALKYPPALQGVANISKCLAHPARIKILKDLIQGPKSSLELALDQPIEQQTVSRHCKVLLDNQIIHSSVIGKKTTYFIVHSTLPTMVWQILKQTGNNENVQFAPLEKQNLEIH